MTTWSRWTVALAAMSSLSFTTRSALAAESGDTSAGTRSAVAPGPPQEFHLRGGRVLVGIRSGEDERTVTIDTAAGPVRVLRLRILDVREARALSAGPEPKRLSPQDVARIQEVILKLQG